MGKNLIQQRRGRAKGRYHVPAHKNRGEIKYNAKGNWEGTVEKIIHDPGRTAPIAEIRLTNHSSVNILATEGMCTGTAVKSTDNKDECTPGNIIEIGHVPEGYPIYNIEIRPGDGGKLVRAGGCSASIVSHTKHLIHHVEQLSAYLQAEDDGKNLL
jgi:large subunit ribosomal protein L2